MTKKEYQLWSYMLFLMVALLASWFFFAWQCKEEKETTTSESQLSTQLGNLRQLTDRLRDTLNRCRDSIVALQVQKGQADIELNRSAAIIKNQMGVYKAAKIVKDTVRLLESCDSIIVYNIPDYATIDRMRNQVIDSLIKKYAAALMAADSLSIICDSTCNLYKSANAAVKKENEQLTKKARSNLVKGLIAGVGGVAVAILALLK